MIGPLLLGGAAGADRTAVGQSLLAHPVVAAALSGWMAGAPREGLWLGLCLGILSAEWIPVGDERPRDTTTIAVAVPLALGASAPLWQWGLGLGVGLLLLRPLGWAIDGVRELSLRFLRRARNQCEKGEVPALERGHFGLAALHFLRGTVTTLVVAQLLGLAASLAMERIDASARELLFALWWAAPLAGLPTLAERRSGWLVGGVVAGVALVWLGGGRW